MVDQIITRQELINAHVDAQALEDIINDGPEIQVQTRLGRIVWTLATLEQRSLLKIQEWQNAIDSIVVDSGVPDSVVINKNGETQEKINNQGSATWYAKSGGYNLNDRVILDNGDIVRSTVANNTNDPNVNMDGWVQASTKIVNSIAELIVINNPKNGDIVYCRSNGGGDFNYSSNQSKVSDGYIVINSGSGQWIKLKNLITVDDFYNLGDVDHSDAFQAMANSVYGGQDVCISNSVPEYIITKTIDFKGKGLRGVSNSRFNAASFNLNCIKVNDGVFLTGFAFRGLRKTLKDIVIIDNQTIKKQIDCFDVDTYELDVSNVTIRGFRDQIQSSVLSVKFHVDKFNGYEAGAYPIHILDSSDHNDSTTVSINNSHFYYSQGSIKFDKLVYNASFTNLIIEYCNEGLTAALFATSTFLNLWFENTLDPNIAVQPCIVGTTSQQSISNQIGQITVNNRWKRPWASGELAPANNIGGYGYGSGVFYINSSTGGKLEVTHNSIKVYPNPYFDTNNRNLDISAADIAPESNRRSYLNLRGNSGYIQLRDVSNTSTAPIDLSRQIGASATANTPLFGLDKHTVNQRSATFTEIGSGVSGHFDSELILVWDSTAGQQTKTKNGGWEIVKTDVGKYTLQRVTGNMQELQSSSIFIGGIFSSAPLLSRVSGTITSYSGSWTGYRVSAGHTFEFTNTAGVLTDPDRFSLSFTMRL